MTYLFLQTFSLFSPGQHNLSFINITILESVTRILGQFWCQDSLGLVVNYV